MSPVGRCSFTALGHSLKLAALAFVIVVPLGIFGGVLAALHVGKAADRVISVIGAFGDGDPRGRLGHRPDPRVRDLAERAADLRQLAAAARASSPRSIT